MIGPENREPKLCARLTTPGIASGSFVRKERPLYNGSMAPTRKGLTTRIIRQGHAAPERSDWEGSTPEGRINAVWLLTRLCLEWSGTGEPRLQRSVCRIQRAAR